MRFLKKHKLLCGYILLLLFSVLAFEIRFTKYFMILMTFISLLGIDYILWKLVVPDLKKCQSIRIRYFLTGLYFLPTALLIFFLIGLCLSHPVEWMPLLRTHLMGFPLLFYLVKIPVFLLLLALTLIEKTSTNPNLLRIGKIISYTIGGMALIALLYATKITAIDYNTVTYPIPVRNLPSSFEKYKILQFSDLHIGSFGFQSSVEKLADRIMEAEADMIVFCGDMVNFNHQELAPYLSILQKVKARDGVYCILGNHDYGTYLEWENPQDSLDNIQELKNMYEKIGWICLDNKSVSIHKNNDSLVIAGVENWGDKPRFPKEANMEKALQFKDTNSCIILLSHDPTYFTLQVREKYKYIPLTLSGHTHAMQMGIKLGNKTFSPAEFLYKEFAGPYHYGDQTLFVNIGSGFNGLPFRFGLKPELSILELSKN